MFISTEALSFFFSRGLSLIFGTGTEICFSPFSHSMNVS